MGGRGPPIASNAAIWQRRTVKAGHSVYFASLPDIIGALAKAELDVDQCSTLLAELSKVRLARANSFR
jgi:DNA replication protein DnaC